MLDRNMWWILVQPRTCRPTINLWENIGISLQPIDADARVGLNPREAAFYLLRRPRRGHHEGAGPHHHTPLSSAIPPSNSLPWSADEPTQEGERGERAERDRDTTTTEDGDGTRADQATTARGVATATAHFPAGGYVLKRRQENSASPASISEESCAPIFLRSLFCSAGPGGAVINAQRGTGGVYS